MALKIALAGEIRSGKDTVADYIYQQHTDMKKLYFAEGIKEIIETYFPEALLKSKKPRKYYQEIGQFMRTLNPNVWVNYTETEYCMLKQAGFENFLCTDLRQPNEYEWLKSKGFVVVKVEADYEVRVERMVASGDAFKVQDLNHPVEQSIKALPYDYLISNNISLEDLFAQVDDVLTELKGGL